MSEEESRGRDSTEHRCPFCKNLVNIDDPGVYREVLSWVHGPKMDGPVLRERTGRVAHPTCVQMIRDGQAPDQESLFDE